MVADLAAVLGPRDAALARELTKYYETVRRAPLTDLAAALAGKSRRKARSSCWSGRPAPRRAGSEEEIDAGSTTALETLSVKDAAAIVSAATGQPRRKVYARAIELTGSSEPCASGALRSADERRAAHGQGVFAERVAILLLRLKFNQSSRGATPFAAARSTSSRGAATPLLSSRSRRGRTLGEAQTAITPAKRRRLSRAARVWLARPTPTRLGSRCAGTLFSSRPGAGRGTCPLRSSWKIFEGGRVSVPNPEEKRSALFGRHPL